MRMLQDSMSRRITLSIHM